MAQSWRMRDLGRLTRRVLAGCALMALTPMCGTGVELDGEVPSAGASGTMGGSAGVGGQSPSAGRGGSMAPGGSGGSGGSGRSGSPGTAATGGSGASDSMGGSVNAGGRGGGEAGTASAGASPSVGGMTADTDGGEGGSGGTDPPTDQSDIEEETIARWNMVADNRPGDTCSFHWVADQFPHPTFKAMGTAEGYGEFAVVLDDFLDENFAFLARYKQFKTPYYSRTLATSDVDLMVTFDQLANDFSTSDYGTTPADVKLSLAEHAANMKKYW